MSRVGARIARCWSHREFLNHITGAVRENPAKLRGNCSTHASLPSVRVKLAKQRYTIVRHSQINKISLPFLLVVTLLPLILFGRDLGVSDSSS